MMKKKVLGSITVLAVAALTAFNVNVNSQENGLSDVSLENVEALAGEHPLGECIYEPWAGCELLDPTDPNEDQKITHWIWP